MFDLRQLWSMLCRVLLPVYWGWHREHIQLVTTVSWSSWHRTQQLGSRALGAQVV